MQPITLLTTYSNNSRALKKIIIAILKKGLASEIKKINYAKSYKLLDGNIQMDNQQMLLITTTKDNISGLEKLMKSMIPGSQIDFVYLSGNVV